MEEWLWSCGWLEKHIVPNYLIEPSTSFRKATSSLIKTKSQNPKKGLKLLGKMEKIMPVTVSAFNNAGFNSETCQMPVDINPVKSCGSRNLHEWPWKWTALTVISNETQEDSIWKGAVLCQSHSDSHDLCLWTVEVGIFNCIYWVSSLTPLQEASSLNSRSFSRSQGI